MMYAITRSALAALLALSLLACNKGGNIVIEPGARPLKLKGSPFVNINQGGKALIVEQGQTATTGVHGFVSVQAVKSSALSSTDSSGIKAVINKNPAAP